MPTETPLINEKTQPAKIFSLIKVRPARQYQNKNKKIIFTIKPDIEKRNL